MGNADSRQKEDVFRASENDFAKTRQSLMTGTPLSAMKKPSKEEDGVTGEEVALRMTIAEAEVKRREETVKSVLTTMRPEHVDLPAVSNYIPHILSDAIFCGHLVTDLDSIAG